MLHARIVEAIEALHRDRLSEQIERLAYHAVRGELRDKAVHYLRQAGNKAAARSALEDARGWFEQALALLDGLPESRSALEQGFEIRLELRPVLTQRGSTMRNDWASACSNRSPPRRRTAGRGDGSTSAGFARVSDPRLAVVHAEGARRGSPGNGLRYTLTEREDDGTMSHGGHGR